MFERSELVIKIVCLGLAVLVLCQLSRLATRRDPLASVKIPVAASLSTGLETRTAPKGTNIVAGSESEKKAADVTPAIKGTNAVRRGINSGPRMELANNQPDLPPAIRARVDRITQSEILGPVIRPLPMALLGIAGKDALVRAPLGQTGWLREGSELGGVKLLRIGTNRVLIEHEGEKKELTLFSGFGSETLLPKGKEKTQ